MSSFSSNDPINLNNNDPDFNLGDGTYTNTPTTLTTGVTGDATLQFAGGGDITLTYSGTLTGAITIDDTGGRAVSISTATAQGGSSVRSTTVDRFDMSGWTLAASNTATGSAIGTLEHAFNGEFTPLTAQASWGLGFPPSDANPGWISATHPTGDTYVPTQFRLVAYANNDRPTDFDIQGWTGTEWVNILANQTMDDTDQTLDVVTNTAYSGFRVFCRGTPGGWFTLVEFAVFGRAPKQRFSTTSGADVNFLIPQGNLTFKDVPTGERVIVRDSDDALVFTEVSTGADIVTGEFNVNTALKWEIRATNFKNIYDQEVTIVQGNTNITPILTNSYGFITPTSTIIGVTSVDGTSRLIDTNGQFALNLQTKTVAFETDYDLADVASATIQAFRDIPEIYNDNVRNPFDLDDVRGVSVLEEWQITNQERVLNSGYAEFDSNGDYSRVDYNIQTEGNNDTVPVRQRFTYNNNAQPWIDIHTGPGDTIINIDDNGSIPDNIINEIMHKNPLNNFYYVREVVRENGGRFQRDYTNLDKTFISTRDLSVTEDVAYDSNVFSYDGSANIQSSDFNGVSHTFNNVFYLQDGTLNIQDAVNQMSKAAAEDDTFLPVDTRASGKPWVFSGGTVTMDEGWWVKYKNGDELTGDFQSLFSFSSSAGDYQFTPSATITINLSTTLNQDILWTVVNTDTREVMTSIGGKQAYSGDFAVFKRGTTTVQAIAFAYTDDVNFAVYYTSTAEDGVEPGVVTGILGSDGQTVTISPAAKQVVYPDRTQLLNSPEEGTKAWNSVIDEVTLDTTNPGAVDIIIPTQYNSQNELIIEYAVDYIIHGYQRIIGEDVRLMRFGILGFNSHQLPTGTLDYKLVPGGYFQNNSALNVPANRPADVPIIITGSKVQRTSGDTSSRRGQVYAIPQANGLLSVTIRTTEGATSQQLTEIQSSLNTVANTQLDSSAVISGVDDVTKRINNKISYQTSAGELFGIAPNSNGAYDSDTVY